MPTVETARIGNLSIEGYAGDYVFETISTTNDFYETELLHKWFPYLSNDKIILDIGANIGNHTLFWATSLPYDQIISFEPFPANYERLSQNILNNQLINVIAVNIGIGDQQGLCSVDNFDETNYGSTSLTREIGTEGDIPVTTVDLYCNDHTIKNIDLVKIDTEGYEAQVLAGMASILSKYLPDLWIEVSNKTYKTVLDQLNALGYKLIDVSGFNMLFLHPTRHNELTPISLETVLGYSFYNLECTNLYYKNYNTAKEWINSRNEQLFQANNKIDDMKLSFDKSESNLNLYEDNLKQVEKILKERDDQADELQWQLTYISEMYRKTDESQRQIITQQKADYEIILTKLMDCFEDYSESIEVIKLLISQNNNLINDNDVLKSNLSTLQNDYDVSIDNAKQLSSQINDLINDNDVLKSNLSTLQNDYDVSIDNAKQLSSQINDLINDNDVLKSNLSTLQNDYDVSIDNAKQLSSQINDLIDDNDVLKSDLSNLQNDYDVSIDNAKQLSSQINDLKKDNDDLNYNNAVLQDKIDRIKRHWLGRLALRLYHLYKRIFKHQK